jgi:hypothetical protein
VDVLHRLVLFLGKRAATCGTATWDELLAALSGKYPDLSKTKLRKIVNVNRPLFRVATNQEIMLREMDHEFVRQYFQLADSVTVVSRPEDGVSLTAPCQVNISGNIITVTGLLCVADKGADDEGAGVLFHFGDELAYRLLNGTSTRNYSQGQRLTSVLHLRKVIQHKSLTLNE